mgnify:FL=1
MSLTLTVKPTLIDRVVPNSLATDVALVLGGAALTALAAQLSIPAQPVPFTFQTLSVLLVGTALGSVRGALSMLVYLLAGLALPVYADGASGVTVLFGATGGYLIGFVLAAALVGYLGETVLSKNVFGMLLSFVAGSAVIYGLGVTVLAATVFGWDMPKAAEAGVYPFLIWDGLKAVIAAGLVPAAWKLTKRSK